MSLESVCRALPFQYGFTGCDTTSSFFNIGKCKWFDYWVNCPEKEQLSSTFIELSSQPLEITPSQLNVLENYILKLYYPSKRNLQSLNIERMNHFSSLPSHNLRLIPFSRLGLVEHTKRTCLQVGFCWAEARVNVTIPDPKKWGLKEGTDVALIPSWEIRNGEYLTVDDITFTCGCTVSPCKNCKCVRAGEKCLPFCKCQRNCDNQ